MLWNSKCRDPKPTTAPLSSTDNSPLKRVSRLWPFPSRLLRRREVCLFSRLQPPSPSPNTRKMTGNQTTGIPHCMLQTCGLEAVWDSLFNTSQVFSECPLPAGLVYGRAQGETEVCFNNKMSQVRLLFPILFYGL